VICVVHVGYFARNVANVQIVISVLVIVENVNERFTRYQNNVKNVSWIYPRICVHVNVHCVVTASYTNR
jgi:hypothetical protein